MLDPFISPEMQERLVRERQTSVDEKGRIPEFLLIDELPEYQK